MTLLWKGVERLGLGLVALEVVWMAQDSPRLVLLRALLADPTAVSWCIEELTEKPSLLLQGPYTWP